MRRVLGWSRYLIGVPVVALFLGAVTLIAVGAVDTVRVIIEIVRGELAEKEAVLEFISLADVFLLSTVLYIIAMGFYELFIDDRLVLPKWLEIHDLDDLKEKLVGVVIVVLAVLFLGIVIKTENPAELLHPGLAIAAVVLALSAFLWQMTRHGKGAANPKEEGEEA
ncbi:MAG: YqhA family protein [Coriobacteriia bacterium]|nr:YqhA family protein [Coriobacteriia bacterium]